MAAITTCFPDEHTHRRLWARHLTDSVSDTPPTRLLHGRLPSRGARALYSLVLFALERSRGAGTLGGVLSLRRQLPHERAHPS